MLDNNKFISNIGSDIHLIGLKHLIEGVKIVASYSSGDVYITDINIPIDGLATGVNLSRENYEPEILHQIWETFLKTFGELNAVNVDETAYSEVVSVEQLKERVIALRDQKGKGGGVALDKNYGSVRRQC